jgi:hypothetical protein
LLDHGDAASQIFEMVLCDIFVIDEYLAMGGIEYPEQGVDNCGFTGTCPTDDAYLLTF